MDKNSILPRDFYCRNTLQVAKDLLGQKLVRAQGKQRVGGIIIETEAYLGAADSASHAFRGPTPRNRVMFGPGGYSYVYFIYGLHYMFNVTTETEGAAAAVLIRALAPTEGIAIMRGHRNVADKDLVNGPAKLCRALAIDKHLDGCDLTLGEQLWIEAVSSLQRRTIMTGPRIGIPYAQPAHQQLPWRFWIDDA